MLTVLPLTLVNKCCQHVYWLPLFTIFDATMLTMLPVSSQCCHNVDCVARCCPYANCDVVPALVSTQLSPAAGQPSQPSTGVPASGRGDQQYQHSTWGHLQTLSWSQPRGTEKICLLFAIFTKNHICVQHHHDF